MILSFFLIISTLFFIIYDLYISQFQMYFPYLYLYLINATSHFVIAPLFLQFMTLFLLMWLFITIWLYKRVNTDLISYSGTLSDFKNECATFHIAIAQICFNILEHAVYIKAVCGPDTCIIQD